MGTTRNILASMLPAMLGLAAGVLACAVIDRCAPHRAQDTSGTVRVVVTDTVRVVQPMAKDSVVVRYKTAVLKQVNAQGQGKAEARKGAEVQGNDLTDKETPAASNDSVEVEIPITQKVYADSAYTAWVSGWEPSLDSIEVYRQKEYITITPKPKLWSIGISAGYGITPKGMQPYVGIGVTYTIKSF